MPTPLRRITAHWPLKLASLGLAMLLWALVSAEQVTMHWIPVRVEPDVRDPRLVLTGGSGPHEVRVLFAGQGRRLWQLALNRPTLVLPIRASEHAGYALTADMIRLPDGIRGVAVREITPAVVRLEVQRLATRDLPVRVRYRRQPGAPYVIRGTPSVSPETVRVSGPADDLSRLRFVETIPLEVGSGDTLDFDLRLPVDTAGLSAFRVSPGTVRVRGEMDQRREEMLSAVLVRGPDGAPAGEVDLRLSGPARVLAEIDHARVRVDELESGLRVAGLPASVQATVLARRAPPAPRADSAAAEPAP